MKTKNCINKLGRFIMLMACIHLGTNLTGQLHLDLQNKSALTLEEIVEETENYFDQVGRERGLGYSQFKRWEYWSRRALDANGTVITNQAIHREIKKYQKEFPTHINRNASGIYEEMGPYSATNTSTWSSHLGRVSAISIDINNQDHIIVGSPSGGVWLTNDRGVTWSTIFDDEVILRVFSVEISHDDATHYFVGTSNGIVRTTDSGATWVTTSGTSGERINTITMHPTDPNILLAVSQFSGEIFRSIDGGSNWTAVYNHNDNMYDLEFHPTDPNIVYASGYGKVVKSTNAGQSFADLTGPYANNGAIMMAVTAADDDILYLAQANTSGGFHALYRSDDEGATFSTQSDNTCNCNNIMGYDLNNPGGQAPRDMDVVVSPTDEDEVHIAGTETHKSTDGGANWTRSTTWLVNGSLPFIHADTDILIYQGNTLYAGTDGGIFYSEDEANTFTDISAGLSIREFYRIGASETDPDRISGGSQDNGTGVVKNGTWFDYLGADGMETFIDYSNEDIMYGSVQFGLLYKSTNGGVSASQTNQVSGNGAWVTPLEQDPQNPSTIYQAKNDLYKSTNAGNSWSQISNLPIGNSQSAKELAIAPSDNQTIYLAYDNQIHRTTNGGTNWTDVSPSISFSQINYITVHELNSDRLIIALSGATEKYLESMDGGATWLDISSNLPIVPAQCVVYEEGVNGGIYVGMSPGVYYQPNGSTIWADVSINLPNVSISELEIRNNILYVSTYGRGLWKIDINLPCPLAFSSANGNQLTGPVSTSVDYESDGVIESTQLIGGANIEVDYDSKAEVLLLPGFQIRSGTLHAFIDGCDGNMFIGEVKDE